MFGFGQKAKLKKMGDELKGASLQEVVSKFASVEYLEPPSLKYDEKIALIFKENLTREEELDIERLTAKVAKIKADHNLADKSHDIYFAYNTYTHLRMYALDLRAATHLHSTNDAVNYLFNMWLKDIPTIYVLPILFPAKIDGRIEDFSIGREIRFAMIDGFFNRLKTEQGFYRLVNAFAAEHPYFRQYPL